jgi:hypothetical protein
MKRSFKKSPIARKPKLSTKPILVMPVDPFGYTLYLCDSAGAHAKVLKDVFGEEKSADFFDGCQGMCSVRESKGVVVVGVFVGNSGVLVHELSHAVLSIFDDRGIPMSKENTEAFAYTIEHLFLKCTRALNELGYKHG